jgi:hypothetical protein
VNYHVFLLVTIVRQQRLFQIQSGGQKIAGTKIIYRKININKKMGSAFLLTSRPQLQFAFLLAVGVAVEP